MTKAYGGGYTFLRLQEKKDKCMKKLIILGLMISLFTFAGTNEEAKTTNAEETVVSNTSVTPRGQEVTLPGDDFFSCLADTTYNGGIVSLKFSNDDSDLLSFQENKVCEPIKVTSYDYIDSEGNVTEYPDGVVSAYLSYASDSTVEKPRYDCVIYANVETIYLSSWASNMFNLLNSSAKPQVIDFGMVNTSRTKSMDSMFAFASGLKAIKGIENWDTSNVTDMSSMFMSCSSLEELNVSKFNTAKVKDMCAMFIGCELLTEIDVSNFDTSSLQKAVEMFDDCPSLKKLDLSKWDLSACLGTFSGASSLSWIVHRCPNLECIYFPSVLPENCTQEDNPFELPTKIANYYGVTNITLENISQYPALCIPGDEYAKKWRALRAENGDSICSLLTPGTEGNTKLTQLLTEYDALDKDYQRYLNLVTDKENVTVGESITYVKNVLAGKQGTDGNYGLSDENKGYFMTMSITEESPYLIAIIALLGVFAVLGYYFYNKKKQC